MTMLVGLLMIIAAPLLRLGALGVELLVALAGAVLVFAGFFGYV
jgi:hypothetical protein